MATNKNEDMPEKVSPLVRRAFSKKVLMVELCDLLRVDFSVFGKPKSRPEKK
jgi:hypothetical protein